MIVHAMVLNNIPEILVCYFLLLVVHQLLGMAKENKSLTRASAAGTHKHWHSRIAGRLFLCLLSLEKREIHDFFAQSLAFPCKYKHIHMMKKKTSTILSHSSSR